MTTNDPNTTNATMPGEDPQDLLDSLKITKTTRRAAGNGTWVVGTMGGHRFEALVFPEHAESETYELDDSRISKLSLQRIDDKALVANFDRGWDKRPSTVVAEQIVDLLASGLAELIYAK